MSHASIAVLGCALAMVAHSRAADAPEWGPTTNGLRMSAAIIQDAPGRELRITIKNVGHTPVEVKLGSTNNVDQFLAFVLDVITPNGSESSFTLLPDLMISGGYFGPLLVQIPPGVTYVRSTHVSDWKNSNNDGEKLAAVGQNGSKIRVELTSRDCGNPKPKRLQCWTGTLRSNMLRPSK